MRWLLLEFTEEIADFAIKMRDVELSEELKEQFRKAYLDYLCAVITGSKTEVGIQVFKYFNKFGGEDSSVIGHAKKLSYIHSAFINGTSAHCLDFDDGHTKGSVHIGSVVFPAVMALGERLSCSNDKLIKATIIGYEVTIKIASTMHPFSRKNGYHNTPIAGIFGTTAAVSYLLDYSYDQIISALGNALSFAGGTFAFLDSGSEIKRLHPGMAARDAIIATELVLEGLNGPSLIFEKKNGVFDVVARGEINQKIAETPLGTHFEMENIYFKPYPCCRHLHVVIDAIKKIKRENQISWESIKKINVGVNHVASQHGHQMCNGLLDSQMSIPYVVATALLDEEITIKSFDQARYDRKQVNELMQKVEVYEDSECEEVYPPKRQANITLYTLTGDEIKVSYDGVLGEHPNPMTLSDVEKKFMTNCEDIIGGEKADEIITNIKTLKTLYVNV
jgi:2-methylcitrate dehydratase PrpD